MHVLLVSHYTLPHVGGIEVCVEQLGRVLAGKGHQVTIVSSRSGAPAEEQRNGIRFRRIRAANFLEERLHVPYPIFAPSLLWTTRQAVRDADVVHAHGVLYENSLCALFWAWRLKKPLVVTEHVGFVPYESRVLNGIQHAALGLSTPLFLHRADAVIALNPAVREWLAKSTPHPERLHMVRNGVDTNRFRPANREEKARARKRLGLPLERPVALFVGRFVQKKGIPLLLEMLDGSFDLVLCGSGRLEPAVQRKDVHIIRDVNHEGMTEIYQAADVFVLPSHGEGFPVSIMEAMACGLPVVAARDRGYDEYVTENEVLQTDPEADSLRTALKWLIDTEAEQRRRAAAVREKAVVAFGMEACAMRHLDIYEQARAGNR